MEEKRLNDVINIFNKFSTWINNLIQNLNQTINNNITKMLKEYNLIIKEIAKKKTQYFGK